MPLVSQMLIHARGTRGAPRKLRDPRFMREVPTSAVDATLRRVFAELSVARPELGLPFRGVEFADVLLDARADLRGDFPLLSPAAVVALLCELARVERRSGPRLSAQVAIVAQRLHLAMTRYLCTYRETAVGAVLVEPTIDPGRWAAFARRRGTLALVLCDALRSTLLLDMERRLRNPIELRRILQDRRATVVVDVLGCVQYRHERWHCRLRAQTWNEHGHYCDHASAIVRPLAPLGSWHWLDGFFNRHRELLQAAVRAAAPESDDADDWAPRLRDWLRANVRGALRRAGVMPGLRRAIRACLPYDPAQLALACRVRRVPTAPLSGFDLMELLAAEAEYRKLALESRALMHLCSVHTHPVRLAWPNEPQHLKSQLHELGLRRAGWRLLCRHGTRVYAALLRDEHDNEDMVALAIAAANLVAACQRPGLPPPELMRQLAEIEDQNTTDDPLVPMPLLRAAWDAALALPTRHARRAFAADAFARAVTWWRCARDRPSVPPGIPWAWFDARTAAWEQRERALRTADAWQWTGPVAAFECQGVRVVPLESMVALWDEGLAMRHCVGGVNFAKACMAGTRRVYSLRDARSGRRLATASCVRKPGEAWREGQVAGFANRDAARADVLAATRELLDALNAAHGADRVDESTVTADGVRAA